MIEAVCFNYFNTCTRAVHRGGGHRRTAEVLGVDPAEWLALLDRTYDERIRGAYGGHFAGLRRLGAELGVEPTTAQLREAVGLTAVQLRAPDLGGHLTFHAEPDWRGASIESLERVPELVGAPILVA
ncbi:hypothetical protein [Dactylosporangium sp. NPDC048998]|uniref:hypothetical protein n=1 Tax=Dactylosporangium sp. NPDC048998 TaxID=3363976 RepID=UPI0037108121